jgi:hypothetical protein
MAEASLLIRIKADGAGVAKGVNDATSQFKRLENTLSGFMGVMRGLFALAPVMAFVSVLKDAVHYAKQIADFAKKTETSLSEAQRLRFGERVLAREGGFSGMIEHLRKTRSDMMREQTSAVKDLHREVQNLSATVKQFMTEAAYTGPATSSF